MSSRRMSASGRGGRGPGGAGPSLRPGRRDGGRRSASGPGSDRCPCPSRCPGPGPSCPAPSWPLRRMRSPGSARVPMRSPRASVSASVGIARPRRRRSREVPRAGARSWHQARLLPVETTTAAPSRRRPTAVSGARVRPASLRSAPGGCLWHGGHQLEVLAGADSEIGPRCAEVGHERRFDREAVEPDLGATSGKVGDSLQLDEQPVTDVATAANSRGKQRMPLRDPATGESWASIQARSCSDSSSPPSRSRRNPAAARPSVR